MQQTPPQFSAIHVAGKRSYALARAGEKVELLPRQIEIEQASFSFLERTRIQYEIRCSKGTYIRSIARDLGEYLGTCACLESIRRTRSEPFSIAEAKTLLQIGEQGIEDSLLPLEALVLHLPRITLSEQELSLIHI